MVRFGEKAGQCPAFLFLANQTPHSLLASIQFPKPDMSQNINTSIIYFDRKIVLAIQNIDAPLLIRHLPFENLSSFS